MLEENIFKTYKNKEEREDVKGQIYIKNGEPKYLENIPTVYIEEARHLYKIGYPDLKYMNRYSNIQIFYKDRLITPLKVYASGYFTLTERYPRITVNFTYYPVKLWGDILELDIHRYSISTDDRIPIYTFEFEVFKAKLQETVNIEELESVMLTIKKNNFRLWCECLKKETVFESIEEPLFIREV